MPKERSMNEYGWRITSSSYVVDTRHLRLRKDCIELPDGTVIEDYYVRESRGFVIIFAMLDEHTVLLVRQYKHGIGKVLLELPAGAIDPDEDPLACASRELTEETGYTGDLELIRTFVTDPTNANTVAHLFFARRVRKSGEQQLDSTERIDVELATFDQLRKYVREGTIDSVPHVGSIYVMLDRLSKL